MTIQEQLESGVAKSQVVIGTGFSEKDKEKAAPTWAQEVIISVVYCCNAIRRPLMKKVEDCFTVHSLVDGLRDLKILLGLKKVGHLGSLGRREGNVQNRRVSSLKTLWMRKTKELLWLVH